MSHPETLATFHVRDWESTDNRVCMISTDADPRVINGSIAIVENIGTHVGSRQDAKFGCELRVVRVISSVFGPAEMELDDLSSCDVEIIKLPDCIVLRLAS